MKALSIRAPWWWWILHGGKIIENRSRRTHYRGPILLHASTWWNFRECYVADNTALRMFFEAADGADQEHLITEHLTDKSRVKHMQDMRGHIVGRADIVDCIPPEERESPWHMDGQYGWVLDNIKPIEPFKVKGALGLFNVDYEE
jgi:hypothetical protein